MKIYTQTYDLSKASPHRFWVAPYSDFKIGIKLLSKGELSGKDFTLKAGSTELTPDEDKVDNYTLFTVKSNGTGFVEYTIEVEGVAEKLKLTQIVTDSTVFEIDASGGDVPADVATQTWVNSQISDFVENGDLTAYYTKSETSSATEISNGLVSKVSGGAETGTTGTPAAITAVKSVYESDWATLSATAVSSTFYVVLPDPMLLTRVKYTTASGLPDWEGDIVGVIQGGGDEEATTQIPNVFSAEEVLIGSNVTGLNDFAFMYCSSLKSVTIGNGVTSIDGAALAETGLSSITIPSNVTTIGFNVLKNCQALTSVTFEGFTKNEVKDMTTGEDKIFGDCFMDNGEPIEKSFTAVCSDGSMTIHFSADWEATITFTDL